MPTALSPNGLLLSRFQTRGAAEDALNFGARRAIFSAFIGSSQPSIPSGVYSVLRLRPRAEYGRSNSVHTQHRRNNHIDAHSLAFFSCHHDTSSLIFDRSLAATHKA